MHVDNKGLLGVKGVWFGLFDEMCDRFSRDDGDGDEKVVDGSVDIALVDIGLLELLGELGAVDDIRLCRMGMFPPSS